MSKREKKLEWKEGRHPLAIKLRKCIAPAMSFPKKCWRNGSYMISEPSDVTRGKWSLSKDDKQWLFSSFSEAIAFHKNIIITKL